MIEDFTDIRTAMIQYEGIEWELSYPHGHLSRRLDKGLPYERKLLNRIRKEGHQGVAIDVGAHVGNHTLFMAIMCGLHVYAFEPHPLRYNLLAKNIGRLSNVTCYNVGLGSRSYEGFFGEDDMAITAMWAVEHQGRGGVSIRSLDEMMHIDDVSVVKIDVEGMECHVLAGMISHLQRCQPIIYSETHNEYAYNAQALVLEPLGYTRTDLLEMSSPISRWEYGG
jgi:FkbM family methyltransferase